MRCATLGCVVQRLRRTDPLRGRIERGQLVTLAPVPPAEVRVDDVVLVERRGNFLLHLVQEIQGDQLLIGNNLGKIRCPSGTTYYRLR